MNKVSHIREEKRRKRSWTDLPQELLELIMRYLSFTDQIHFRATCRDLKSVARILPSDQLPWLVAYDNCGSYYTLYDPSNKYTYTINIKPKDPAYMIFNSITIRASKFGWLLLYQFSRNLLFFFNPFTKEVIELPPLEFQQCKAASFSSPPTEPDCIVLAFYNSYLCTQITTICPLKDEKWTTYELNPHFHPIKNIVYSKRNFYCVESSGALGVFNVDEGKWKSLPESKATERSGYLQKTYLIEGDGEILLVIACCLFSWIRFFRLDFSKMKWVTVEKSENGTLFLTNSTSVAACTTVREMMDRLHYISHRSMKFHSLKACRSYQCTKYYGRVAAEKKVTKMWIQPPY